MVFTQCLQYVRLCMYPDDPENMFALTLECIHTVPQRSRLNILVPVSVTLDLFQCGMSDVSATVLQYTVF